MSANSLIILGGAGGEISRASIIMHPLPFSLSPRGRGAGVRGGIKWGQPPRALPRSMGEALPPYPLCSLPLI
mgnify:FL=1